MDRFRVYLKLLARNQLDTWLGQRIDASDIVQQTLLDAIGRRGQFRGRSEAEFLAWLRKILASNLIDEFRYDGRARRDMAHCCSLYEDAGNPPNTQVILHDYPESPILFETRGLPKSKHDQTGKE